MKGKYTLQITNLVLHLMTNGNDIEVVWHSDKKKRKKNNTLYCIDKELVKVLLHEMRKKTQLVFNVKVLNRDGTPPNSMWWTYWSCHPHPPINNYNLRIDFCMGHFHLIGGTTISQRC